MSKLTKALDFGYFATGVGKGLAVAATSDIDVFLLACTAGLLGSRSRRLRATGAALGAYVTFRRVDGYIGAISSNLTRIGRVMADTEVRQASPRFQLLPNGTLTKIDG